MFSNHDNYMTTRTPLSATDVRHRIIEKFLEDRKYRIEERHHPVRDADDLAALVLRFAIKGVKQYRGKMSDREGLDVCAEQVCAMFVERDFQDPREIDSIWGGWQAMLSRLNWYEQPEFIDLWHALMCAEQSVPQSVAA